MEIIRDCDFLCPYFKKKMSYSYCNKDQQTNLENAECRYNLRPLIIRTDPQEESLLEKELR
jgi:hypothetical protein